MVRQLTSESVADYIKHTNLDEATKVILQTRAFAQSKTSRQHSYTYNSSLLSVNKFVKLLAEYGVKTTAEKIGWDTE